MVDHFKDISDDDYTATLEKRLDEVERGNQEWVPVVSDFYGPLQKMLVAAEKAMPADTDEECPLCHEGHLVLNASSSGPFMGSSQYPKRRSPPPTSRTTHTPHPTLLTQPPHS